jgi:hypothetical protein
MPRAVNTNVKAAEAVVEPVVAAPQAVQGIHATLSFEDVLRIQRKLEADGLAVPPAEPPPRKKLRSF